MKTWKNLQAGALLVALTASMVLPASDALARPKNRGYNGHDHGSSWWTHNNRSKDRDYYRDRDDRDHYRDRYDRDHYRDRYDRDHYRDRYDRDDYQGRYDRYSPFRSYEVRTLPYGCRRVVIRNRTYYTPDNRVFYAYNPSRRVYVTVNLLNVGIGW